MQKDFPCIHEQAPHIYQLSDKKISFLGKKYPCAIGKRGFIAASQKREGDLKTPTGRYTIINLYYRPDRITLPDVHIPTREISPNDGWCDDVNDAHYNQFIQKPFDANHENLWRDTCEYDVLMTTNHNQTPTISGAGSAVFIHIPSDDNDTILKPTAGCLRLLKHDFFDILPHLTPESQWIIPDFLLKS